MATSALSIMKLFCVGLLGLLLLQLQAPHAEAAMNCNQVYSALTPCMSYITGGQLSSGCCPGIRTLKSHAATKADRQNACGCLKQLASGYPASVGKAKQLLNKCSVSLPYPLDPNIDCSRVN